MRICHRHSLWALDAEKMAMLKRTGARLPPWPVALCVALSVVDPLPAERMILDVNCYKGEDTQ